MRGYIPLYPKQSKLQRAVVIRAKGVFDMHTFCARLNEHINSLRSKRMLNGIFDIVSSFDAQSDEGQQGQRRPRYKGKHLPANPQQLAEEQRDLWLKSLAFFIFK